LFRGKWWENHGNMMDFGLKKIIYGDCEYPMARLEYYSRE
jgi:hypothetical protein